MPGQPHTPLHPQYRCQSCNAIVGSQITVYRAFNYGRCHCGGELRAIEDPVRQAAKKQGVL